MHILDEKFRRELVDKYIGRAATAFMSPKDRFYDVLCYLATHEIDAPVDEVRKLIDALADWTNNPTESELRKILDVEERVSGYGMTYNANEAIMLIAYCITHEIPCSVDFERELYKISFKDITISQRDVIIKMGNDIHFISSQLYPKENGKEN